MEMWQIGILIGVIFLCLGIAFGIYRKKRKVIPKEEAEKEVKKVKEEMLPEQVVPTKPAEKIEKEITKKIEERPAEIIEKAKEEKVELKKEEVEEKREAVQVSVEIEKKPPSREKILPIRKGLEKTRGGLIFKLKSLLGGKKELDPALVAQIEELFITSDIGVKTTELFIEKLKEQFAKKEINETEVWAFLREEAKRTLSLKFEPPSTSPGDVYTIMVVGVNGSGKTTTIGKIANRFKQNNKKVMLAAADTFRAAATSQLEVWGRRVGCDVIKGKEGADPSSVVFEAIEKAKSEGMDIVIADTAGRLHTKVPLMEELKKIKRVMGKAQTSAPHEVLLVLDATTGQNGVAQAKSFFESLEVTGIVLTKLDGTAKGGVILSICNDMKIPVRFIGIGEGIDDLKDFDAEEFVSALFDEVLQKEEAA